MRIADPRDIRFSNAIGAGLPACLFQCVGEQLIAKANVTEARNGFFH